MLLRLSGHYRKTTADLFDEPPWALINFFDLESGRLIEAGRLLNFHHSQQV